MIKQRKRRLLILAIVFATFNVLAFAIPLPRNSVFWIAYVFSAVTILAQIPVDIVAFGKADTLKHVVMGIPIVKVAYQCLVAQLVVCAILMITTFVIALPAWVAVVPCTLILAFGAVKVISTDWARDKIEKIDAKSLKETKFIHQLHADLESLLPCVMENTLKNKIKKLSTAMRYSDPVSCEGLAGLEAEMEQKLSALKQSILSSDPNAERLADELAYMLHERNQKSRVLR